MALKQRGIRAEYISSVQANPNVLRNAESGQYDILYLTPEKACGLTNSFWSRLLDSGICLLAVDEAHCISEWGHSFRVEYKQLDMLRDVLLNVAVVGLTATATGNFCRFLSLLMWRELLLDYTMDKCLRKHARIPTDHSLEMTFMSWLPQYKICNPLWLPKEFGIILSGKWTMWLRWYSFNLHAVLYEKRLFKS